MDRKVIKLEAAYGSERQTVIVKREQDIIVRDIIEDMHKVFKIPIEQIVIFHKGTSLSEFINDSLETLGIENNHQIRVTRDSELPNKTSRSNIGTTRINSNMGNYYNTKPFLDTSNRNQEAGDVLKVHVSYGSEREYVLINGKRPILIRDLKAELYKVFKIPTEQQCIVFKGYNLHDYVDDAPLDAFGVENNSTINLWPKINYQPQDIRLPGSQSNTLQIANAFSPRPQVKTEKQG